MDRAWTNDLEAVRWFLERWGDETDEGFVEFAADRDAFVEVSPFWEGSYEGLQAEVSRVAEVFVEGWRAHRLAVSA